MVRRDIQALRAVAVGLVLVVHLWPEVLPGGFVGVDVFFVISGFLIIGHLLREVETTGTVSLSRFWARRVRRLLPAAGVVLLFSLVAAVAFLPRSLWQRTVTEIAASALYVQNWLLGANAVDYFAAQNTPTVVQHFWSLSVEEQFYIVWPVLILLAIVAFRRRSRLAVGVLLVAVVAASLAWSVIETGVNQPGAYFSTLTRAWEFGAGGLLAMTPAVLDRLRGQRVRDTVAVAASWFGYALILAPAVLYGPTSQFPGYLAVAPVVGTLLVIAARSEGGSWSASYLGNFGPVQFVGDLSYSIYLWHWPLIIIAPYVLGKSPGWKWDLVIVAATIGLAWLSKVFVEDPIRTKLWWTARPRRSFVFAAGLIAVLVAASGATWFVVQAGKDESQLAAQQLLSTDPCYGASAMMQLNSCPHPYAVPDGLNTAFAAEDKFSIWSNCGPELDSTEFRICRFGDLENPVHRVALIGNSHANQLTPGLDVYGQEHHWEIELMSRYHCLGVTAMRVTDSPRPECLVWSARVIEELARPDIDTVVFASHDNALGYIAPKGVGDADRAVLQSSISDTFATLVAMGKTVIVLGDTPSLDFVAPECIDEHYGKYDPCSFAIEDSGENIVTDAAKATPGVNYIDMTPYFCDAGTCHVMIGGVVVYFDDNHISATFSRTLAPWLGDSLAKAMK